MEGMSTSTMWKRYVNKVKLTPLTMARPSKWQSMAPLHYELNTKHNPVVYGMIKRKAKLPIEQIQQDKRANINKIEDQGRRIEQSIRRMQQLGDEMKEASSALVDVTLGDNKQR